MNNFSFKCPNCFKQIDQEIDKYYRKKYNKEISLLQDKIKRMKTQLATYHSNDKKWYNREDNCGK